MTENLQRRFYITRKLGSGQAANVCLAEDLRNKRTVALKLFDSAELGDALDELTAIEKLHSKMDAELESTTAIPQYYGFHRFDNGMLGLSMSHVDAVPLYRMCVRNPRMLIVSLFTALELIHSRGVAHRDVNPYNVLLRADGTCCLVDFNWAVTQETCDDVQASSLNYASPELLFYDLNTSAWPLSTGNDVWGAAVLIISQCMNLRFPWMLDKRGSIEHHFLMSVVPPLEEAQYTLKSACQLQAAQQAVFAQQDVFSQQLAFQPAQLLLVETHCSLYTLTNVAMAPLSQRFSAGGIKKLFS